MSFIIVAVAVVVVDYPVSFNLLFDDKEAASKSKFEVWTYTFSVIHLLVLIIVSIGLIVEHFLTTYIFYITLLITGDWTICVDTWLWMNKDSPNFYCVAGTLINKRNYTYVKVAYNYNLYMYASTKI